MSFEDESPMVEHRSLFDTIPAPPPDASEPEFVNGVYTLSSEAQCRNLMRSLTAGELRAMGIDYTGNGPLVFPGGAVELPKPVHADLVLNAQQWATRAREDMRDQGWVAEGVFDRLDAALAELAAK